MLLKMLDILFGKFLFQVDGASGGASGGDGAGGASGGSDGGASGSAPAGDNKNALPDGFSVEKWEKLKSVDPDKWEKVKDFDPETVTKTKSFYDRVASDSALFDKIMKEVEKHESTFSNPEFKRIADEMKTMRQYIQNQEAEKEALAQAEYQKQFETDLQKASEDVAKELKFENVMDFDKELIKENVIRAYAKDQQGEKKLSIKDLKNLVSESVKKIDGYRREVLKASVKKDSSPDPIKDGKTGDHKPDRDLRSKDSRVEEAQKFLQEQLKTA